MPRIVLMPDSFKGTATAPEVAEAMKRGVLAVWPDAEVVALPFADGGEGTLDVLLETGTYTPQTVQTVDALGLPITAQYGINENVAVIEAAQANGLLHVQDVPLEPLRASSEGVGLIIRDALDRGARNIQLFIGGTASTDGGSGLLSALGAKLLDAQGNELAPGGGNLGDLHSIDFSEFASRAYNAKWTIGTDVTNPLTGSAAVYGPQKGAIEADIDLLERNLQHFANVLYETSGIAVHHVPGAGAGGGIPSPLLALFNAKITSGARLIAEALNAEQELARADLVLTGEGRFDASSLQGKAVSIVRELTPRETPVIVVAGSTDLPANEARLAGFAGVYTLNSFGTDAELQQTVLADIERVVAARIRHT